MGAIVTIARRDLKSYFTSPKGAAIFFFFLLFMGFFFRSFIATFIKAEQQSQQMGGSGLSLEQLVRALFANLHFILILIIPAVTMSTFASEKRSQSIRLLQTAPISATQIVLGKFASSAFFMLLVLIASTAYPIYTVIYGNPDTGIIISSFVGVFLLMCSQLAFGLWISSLTSNQFLAFIFTMFGLFMLLILNWAAPSISTEGSWVQSAMQYIASTDHFDSFLKGSINIKDTLYFVLFTASFLFLTNVSLDSQRWR